MSFIDMRIKIMDKFHMCHPKLTVCHKFLTFHKFSIHDLNPPYE